MHINNDSGIIQTFCTMNQSRRQNVLSSQLNGAWWTCLCPSTKLMFATT